MNAAVLLIDPKFSHNVGGALRACASMGARNLRWTGERVESPKDEKSVAIVSTRFPRAARKRRFPREERMKAYNSVYWSREVRDRPVSRLAWELDLVPVAVEVLDHAESLPDFVHPENALYVFGPEDGGLGHGALEACHRFVTIPTTGCLNLAAAVNVLLYDRLSKIGVVAQQVERRSEAPEVVGSIPTHSTPSCEETAC